ncbi:MAG: hypothetical protein V4687_14970 [Bacteroidota bacterium]
MKRLLLLLSIGISVCYISCDKNEEEGPGEIYGRWKLLETLSDPGDGSGKYVKTKKDLYATFDRSGTLEGDALPGATSFKILDSVSIQISSKEPDRSLTYRYKVSAKSLWVYPPCFEGCGMHFIRK